MGKALVNSIDFLTSFDRRSSQGIFLFMFLKSMVYYLTLLSDINFIYLIHMKKEETVVYERILLVMELA